MFTNIGPQTYIIPLRRLSSSITYLSGFIKMTESAYFSSSRLTRSKLKSKNGDLQLSPVTGGSKSTLSSKFKAQGRQRQGVKIEGQLQEAEQILVGPIKKEEMKPESIFADGQPDDQANIKKDRWEPPDWRTQLQNINEMRKKRDAPVDTMGCDVISDALASPEVMHLWQRLLPN